MFTKERRPFIHESVSRLSNLRLSHIVLYGIVIRLKIFQQNRNHCHHSQQISGHHIASSYFPGFTDERHKFKLAEPCLIRIDRPWRNIMCPCQMTASPSWSKNARSGHSYISIVVLVRNVDAWHVSGSWPHRHTTLFTQTWQRWEIISVGFV